MTRKFEPVVDASSLATFSHTPSHTLYIFAVYLLLSHICHSQLYLGTVPHRYSYTVLFV